MKIISVIALFIAWCLHRLGLLPFCPFCALKTLLIAITQWFGRRAYRKMVNRVGEENAKLIMRRMFEKNLCFRTEDAPEKLIERIEVDK